MSFKNNSYLHNKHTLSPERQKELEAGFEIYYSATIKGVKSWDPLVTTWWHGTSLTKKRIVDVLEPNVLIEVREPYELGFNYDIDGRIM